MKTISAKLKINCYSHRNKSVGTFLINQNSLKQITPTFNNMIELCKYLNTYFPQRNMISNNEYELNIL
jgi:hypothetical protein